MDFDACFQLGHVIKPHGLNGEVSILLDVDQPQNYTKLESVFIDINKKLVPFFIESFKLKNNIAVIKFEDVGSLETLEPLLGKDLFLPLDLLPARKGNHFYYHEILQFTIEDKSLGRLGNVVSVYTHPNQDLIAMEYKGREVLIPVNDEIILSLDRDQSILHVNMPYGLLDVYMD